MTGLVYPALADTPSAAWATAHRRHTRRITPVVGIVYVAAAAACVAVLVDGPRTPATLAAVVATGVAAGTTALVAAPLHGRLGTGHDVARVHRLLVADRVRLAASLVALAAALVAVGAR